MIGKSLFLLVFVIWLYITAKFYEDYTLGPIISFLILCLATWKVFGISKAFLLIAFGVLIYVMDSDYVINYDFVDKEFLIPFCITCLFGWGVFEWVVKPLGRQWLSAYGAIGLIIIIIAIIFTLMLMVGIHKRFENKDKVEEALRDVDDIREHHDQKMFEEWEREEREEREK